MQSLIYAFDARGDAPLDLFESMQSHTLYSLHVRIPDSTYMPQGYILWISDFLCSVILKSSDNNVVA